MTDYTTPQTVSVSYTLQSLNIPVELARGIDCLHRYYRTARPAFAVVHPSAFIVAPEADRIVDGLTVRPDRRVSVGTMRVFGTEVQS